MTPRWLFSAPIRVRRVLAIFTHFHSRHCEINFKKEEDAARESTPRTAIEDLRARAYGSEKPEARAIQRAIYKHHPGPLTWRTRRAVPQKHEKSMERFLVKLASQPKDRIESEPRGPSQLRGVRGVACIAPSQLQIVTICHGLQVFVLILPCFGHFGWPFPSQDFCALITL